jgi:hypothetical protein
MISEHLEKEKCIVGVGATHKTHAQILFLFKEHNYEMQISILRKNNNIELEWKNYKMLVRHNLKTVA